MDHMKSYRWPLAYLAVIVILNWVFITVKPFHMSWGFLTPGVFLVGFVYLFRDIAQRAIGHRVLFFMAAGLALTYWMSPRLALASGVAFAVGEGIEWTVFTFTGLPFSKRVIWSVVPGVLADTAIFLLLAGFYSHLNLGVETVCKCAALALIRFIPDPLTRSEYSNVN
jgi:uncharacterized PurR-regulated membrane protein YhhQ (DUF165 family)